MEIWKDVKGFEKVYQVSNKGNVRSLDRTEITRAGKQVKRKGKVLKPVPNSNGYLRVCLRHEGKEKKAFVHRLVAEAFCENKDEAVNNVVNHLDSNFLNNCSSNLEWTTLKGNSQHALKKGRLKRTKQWIDRLKKSLAHTTKAIEAYNPTTGEIVERFEKLTESKGKGYEASCVCMCCKGRRERHRGLCWRYVEKGDDNQ